MLGILNFIPQLVNNSPIAYVRYFIMRLDVKNYLSNGLFMDVNLKFQILIPLK